jgi:ferrochelatase
VTKTAIVLVNLGTPDAPTPAAIRRFLANFLADRRVVELPRILWLIILYVFVVPLRPFKIAPMYQRLWNTFGDSPLRVFGDRLRKKLQTAMQDQSVTIAQAYSYGHSPIADVLNQLSEQGCEKIIVLPLFPQFSATTTAPIYDQVGDWIKTQRNLPAISLLKDYHQQPDYISAMAAKIRQHWQTTGRKQRLLLSFHSIPRLCVERGDPYQQQCEKTAELLIKELNLAEHEWGMSYQSRLGKGQWLQPYTTQLLKSWAKDGIESVDVFCPAFAVDCIETIEEIDAENREVFLHAGGQSFAYIECLNDSDEHINLFKNLLSKYL